MKKLVLIRHASAVDYSTDGDFGRILKKKGIRQAEKLALYFSENNICCDLFVSSNAARARETAEIVFNSIARGCGLQTMHLSEALYLPSAGQLFDFINELDGDPDSIFLCSHNNGISDFAQITCSKAGIMMLTGSAVIIECDIENWQKLEPGKGRLLEFIS